MSKTTKELIAEIYAQHKEHVLADKVHTDGGVALVVTNLGEKPASARVLSFDEQSKRLDSFGFVETGRNMRLDLRAKGIWSRARILNDLGEDRKTHEQFQDYPASSSVHDFGLFGTDPEIGAYAYEAFVQRAKDTLSAEDAERVLAELETTKDLFVKAENARLRKPLSDFGVDPIHKDAVRVLDALSDYDWKTLRFYGGQDERGLYRRQAAEIYPLMATFFAHNSSFARQVIQKQKPLNAELAKVFGVKEKTLKRLRGVSWNTNGLSIEEIIDHASSIPPDWFPKDEDEWNAFTLVSKTIGRRLKSALAEVTDKPLDVLYKGSKGQWQEFHRRCAMAFMDTRAPQGLEPDFEKELREKIDWKRIEKAAKKSDRDHRSTVDRQLSQFEFPDPQLRKEVRDWALRLHKPDMSEFGLQTAVDQTMEMVEFVRNHIVIPAAASRVLQIGNLDDICIAGNQFNAARQSTLQLLFLPDPENPGAGKTAPNIFENTRFFLNDMARISEQVIGEGIAIDTLAGLPEGHWARLFGGNPVAPNGIYFESLTCSEELTQEGYRGINPDGVEGLHHCVGGYTSTCRDRFNHIVSLRRRVQVRDPQSGQQVNTFVRLATVQFEKIDDFSKPLQQRQFYAIRDTKPPAEMQNALAWFKQAVASKEIVLNETQITQFMAAAGERVLSDEVEGVCGYKWKEDDNITNAMMAVGRLVHKGVTKDVRGIDDFVSHPVLKPLVASIDPIYGATMDREPELEVAAPGM